MRDFNPNAIAEIRARLDAARASGVRIGFAIESGSRAWGFPSPDSDYDCRFVYVRPRSDYLSLFPPRDVIEFPIVGDIDAGGWDLRKALLLALKGNAVLVEWVTSPIVYEEEPGFRKRLGTLLDEIMVPHKVALHYVGLLKQHHPGGDEAIKLKKLLYAIRPAIALRWMEERDFALLAPMNMLECLESCRLPAEQRETILELIEVKKVTREMGEGAIPAGISALLADTLLRYQSLGTSFGRDATADAMAQKRADAFFLSETDRTDSLAQSSSNPCQIVPVRLD